MIEPGAAGDAWRLGGEALAWLLGAVDDPAALPFARAVALQVARASAGPAAEAERSAASRVASLLRAPDAPGGAERLAADLPLLASCFQNVDLLFLHEHPGADEVSRLILQAMEHLEPTP